MLPPFQEVHQLSWVPDSKKNQREKHFFAKNEDEEDNENEKDFLGG